MSWPLASHFSAALQNPRIAFRDPELKRCRIEKDRRNQPRPWSGAFAVVYKGISADGGRPFAVRVFTTESPERRERYGLISDYLRSRPVDCLVEFEYRDESIRSAGDGKWYPVIIMDWVEGETLFKWVRARCLEGDQEALEAAANRWIELVKELGDARIAHGDLQHANVMVTPSGQLKLVDYDGMCVPALVGRRNLEVGVEPYQHPDRNETTHLALDLDHFSALVIHVALRALAADPTLWTRYVEQPVHDKLLFRSEDFRSQGRSPLGGELAKSPAEDVRELAGKLFSFFKGPMDQVPPLGHLTHSYAKVERLLLTRQWAAAVDVLNRRGQFRDAPDHLKPLIHEAYEHVCRQQAWAAYKKIPRELSERSDRQLVAAWNETLFAGFAPAERERPRVAAARKHVAVLDRLCHFMQTAPKEASLAHERNVAAAAKGLPKGYQYALRPRVQRARLCVEGIARLALALRDEPSEAAIVAAWRKVVEARAERFAKAEWRRRIEMAEKRLEMIEALERIPNELPPDQYDRRLLDAWDDRLAADCKEVEPWRRVYREAVYRKQLLARIEQAIQQGDDAAVVGLVADPSLEGFALPASWSAAIGAAGDRVAKTEALLASLENDDRSSFMELFDARIIRKYAGRFAAYESPLSEWTRSEILLPERLGLRPAVGRASLFCIDRAQRAYRVRWTWPQQRFADECILAICHEHPSPEIDPRDLEAHYRLPLDRRHWESGGGSRLIHAEPEWDASYVVVWAMIDLGFRTFASRPLVLGQLEGSRKRRGQGRKGWSLLSPLRKKPSAGPTPVADPAEPAGDKDDPP
ncbi:MAG: protein kinase domain-containing protein [Planctomycetota bacterium]|jgi:hypothetical protein